MKLSLLKMLLLVCALTGLSHRNVAHAAPAIGAPQVETKVCKVADIECFRLMVLDKQDELVSLGKTLGLKDSQIDLLQQSVTIVTQQRDLALDTQKTLFDSAQKLLPHWYDSPQLWFGTGLVIGIGLTILTAWAVIHVAAAH